MEFALSHCFYYGFIQHEVLFIAFRYDYALITGQTPGAAELKKALNFFVNTAYGLNLSFLVNRSSYGQVLFYGKL